MHPVRLSFYNCANGGTLLQIHPAKYPRHLLLIWYNGSTRPAFAQQNDRTAAFGQPVQTVGNLLRGGYNPLPEITRLTIVYASSLLLGTKNPPANAGGL